MRALRLMPFLLVLLAGCSDQRASFMPNDQQSLTALVQQQWPWSRATLSVVVRSEPKCQRMFFLQELADRKVTLDVYRYDGSAYALLAAGQKYVFDVASCEITRYRDIPDLRDVDRLGQFNWKDDRFEFHEAAK